MRITVIGTGYVGLVTAACLADVGNSVYGVDSNREKIALILRGKMPIYEPELQDMVLGGMKERRLRFTTDLSHALGETDICFIAVGTPMGEDGSADLRYVRTVAREIGEVMQHELLVVDKSTVPVGTGDEVEAIVAQELKARGREDIPFQVVSNPEFLKEGSALSDFSRPDRVIIGTDDEGAIKTMRQLYAPFVRNSDRFVTMNRRSAEMAKYASNAMLATRISFMNEMAAICESVGANVNAVRLGMGSDKRIGYSFLYAGCGYGGSCFPKDVRALIKTAQDHGVPSDILTQIDRVNQRQKGVLVQKVVRRFGASLEGLTFAIWGLTYKPGTDDMREAPSIVIIRELLERGATIRAYDPIATMPDRESHLGRHERLIHINEKYEAAAAADALLLITEWKEFKSPSFPELKAAMKQPVIFDGRNQYDAEYLAEAGFEYHQIGVGKEKS